MHGTDWEAAGFDRRIPRGEITVAQTRVALAERHARREMTAALDWLARRA